MCENLSHTEVVCRMLIARHTRTNTKVVAGSHDVNCSHFLGNTRATKQEDEVFQVRRGRKYSRNETTFGNGPAVGIQPVHSRDIAIHLFSLSLALSSLGIVFYLQDT